MDNRAQSALEYLMTYGWALVVIVIVIAALFAFGIFNPPSAGTCTGLNKLAYLQHSVSGGTFYLLVSNGAGSAINVTSVSFSTNSANGIAFTGVTGTNFPTAAVNSAATIDINSTGHTPTASEFATGTYSQKVTITYTQASIPHTETATCTGNI